MHHPLLDMATQTEEVRSFPDGANQRATATAPSLNDQQQQQQQNGGGGGGRKKAEIRSWAGAQNTRTMVLGDDGLDSGKKSQQGSGSGFHIWGCVGGEGKPFCSPFRTLPKELAWASRKGGIIAFIDACLRGIGQVFFQNSPITGLVCLAAILASDLLVGFFAVVGVTSATLFAKVFSFDPGLTASGILGYNGALAGCALAVFNFGSEDVEKDSQYNVLFGVVLTSVFSVVITSGLASVMVPALRVTPLTFPFQLVTWLWLLTAQRSSHFPATFAPSPSLADLGSEGPRFPETESYDGSKVVESVFSGVAQTFLVSDWYSGLIMLVGISLCSPIAGGWALGGSIIGTLSAMSIGVDPSSLYAGLYGYNGALCGIAIGGFFLVLRGSRVYALALVSAFVSSWVNAAVAAFLQPMGLPALTFPFTVVVWIFILAAATLPSTFTVGIESLTSSEDHIERLLLNDKLTSAFDLVRQFISFESDTTPESISKIEDTLLPLVLCSEAERGETAEIETMIRLGADINKADYDGRTALHLAVAEGHTELVEFLLENGADANAEDTWGGTPMEDLVRSNCLSTNRFQYILHVLELRNGKLNMQSKSLSAGSRMCQSAYEGKVESIRRLLAAGVPADTADYDNRTAAHIAAAGFSPTSDLQILELLISSGKEAVLSVKDRYGNTPVDDAIRHKFHRAIDMLNDHLSVKIDINSDRAEQKGEDASQVHPTVKRGADSIARFKTATTKPSGEGRDEANDQAQFLPMQNIIDNEPMFFDVALKMAKDEGYSKSAKQEFDRLLPSLMCAFAADPNSSSGQLQKLLTSGFSARVCDYDFRTPLHIAVENGDKPTVELLLNKGADPTIQDRWGVTPLWTAICRGHDVLAVLLRSHGATLGCTECSVGIYLCALASDPSNTPLLRCAVLNGGCSPSASDYDGRTPLHVAADLGNDSIVSLLLELGARTDLMDRWGHYPNVDSKN